MAVLFSWLVGVPLGILSAMKRNAWLDYVSRGLTTFFLAVPSFWIGLVIVLVGVLVFTWRPPLTIIYFWDDPGPEPADDARAGVRARPRARGADGADDPLGDPGGAPRGLRADRPRERPARAAGGLCGTSCATRCCRS